MNTTLAKQSALEVLAHLACRRPASRLFPGEADPVWEAPCQKSLEDIQKRWGFLRKPIHVAVPQVQFRRNLRSATVHVDRHLVLPGTVWGLDDSTSIVSPAVCVAQFSRELGPVHLAELACALAGLYKFAPSSTGSILDAHPITTVGEISRMLEKYPSMYGARKALGATGLAIDRLGSPYETILYLLLCLPRALGGYGVPKPVANVEIVPSSFQRGLVSQRSFHPDLLWPEARLVVEYDSRQQHSQPDQADRDARRRNDLETLGYTVVAVTGSIIADESLFDKVALRLRQHLGLSPWRETGDSRARRRELRRTLLLAPTPLAGYWR